MRAATSRATPIVHLAALACLGALAAAFPAPAVAAPPCGTSITTAMLSPKGVFELDADMTCTGGDALVAGASNIVIDLKGHVLTGAQDGNLNGGAGVRVPWGGVNGVEIRNGTIRGFGVGVVLDSTAGNHLWNLTLAGNVKGVDVANANENLIEKNRITGSGLDAVRMGGDSHANQVVQNMLGGNQFGISAADSAHENTIAQNQIAGTVTGAVSVYGDDNVVSRNFVTTTAQHGIVIAGTARRTTVSQNKALGNGGDGIAVASATTGTQLVQNTASSNGDDGIDVDTADATVTRNTATYNFDVGIEAEAGVTDGGGNVAYGNGTAQCTGTLTCSP